MPTKLRRDPNCERRNLLIGLDGGVECSPVRWLSADEFAAAVAEQSARPKLPANKEEAMSRINAGLAKPLDAENVYIHNMQAASDVYISDRYMFLHRSTIDNIVSGANNGGFAFMNSHRTGRMSSASELPFGRAFAGQVRTVKDAAGRKTRQALLSVYMLKGVSPNGANGPSTDDLSASIDAGTIFDVSMGLAAGGRQICDVCGQDLYGTDEEGSYVCPHVPGSHRKMSAEQRQAQLDRGVPNGIATYSLADAHPAEVSAVYDGAIPGAGFSKAHKFLASGRLSRGDLDEIFQAYPLLFETKRGKAMGAKRTFSLAGLAAMLTGRPAHTIDPDEEFEVEMDATGTVPARFAQQERTAPAQSPPAGPPTPSATELALQERVNRLELQVSNNRAAELGSALASSNRIVPAERADLVSLAGILAEDDRLHPLTEGVSRFERLQRLFNLRTPHTLGRENVVSDGTKPGVKAAAKFGAKPGNATNALPADTAGDTEEELAQAAEDDARAWARRKYGRDDD